MQRVTRPGWERRSVRKLAGGRHRACRCSQVASRWRVGLQWHCRLGIDAEPERGSGYVPPRGSHVARGGRERMCRRIAHIGRIPRARRNERPCAAFASGRRSLRCAVRTGQTRQRRRSPGRRCTSRAQSYCRLLGFASILQWFTSALVAARATASEHLVAAATGNARTRSSRTTTAIHRCIGSRRVLHHVDHPLDHAGRQVVSPSPDLDHSKASRACHGEIENARTLKRSRPMCSSSSNMASIELKSLWPDGEQKAG